MLIITKRSKFPRIEELAALLGADISYGHDDRRLYRNIDGIKINWGCDFGKSTKLCQIGSNPDGIKQINWRTILHGEMSTSNLYTLLEFSRRPTPGFAIPLNGKSRGRIFQIGEILNGRCLDGRVFKTYPRLYEKKFTLSIMFDRIISVRELKSDTCSSSRYLKFDEIRPFIPFIAFRVAKRFRNDFIEIDVYVDPASPNTKFIIDEVRFTINLTKDFVLQKAARIIREFLSGNLKKFYINGAEIWPDLTEEEALSKFVYGYKEWREKQQPFLKVEVPPQETTSSPILFIPI